MLAVSSENITVLAAFGGGIISILSPCVLPMVPGYLSVVSGFSIAELSDVTEDPWARVSRIGITTALFTLGFGTVFTLLGLAASAIGQTLFDNQATLTRISGVVIMAMALYLAGSQLLNAPWLYQEKRFHVSRRFGWMTAPIVGAAFGFGWSPCLGPFLAAVVGAAAKETSARAVGLLAAYSIGMGVAFFVVGIAFGVSAGALDAVKRHMKAITLVSAAILFGFGLLLALDQMQWLTAKVTDVLEWFGLGSWVKKG